METKTAKLDRALFFRIGKGELDISKSAIQFMFHTINYVAKDGRILCTDDMIRMALMFQHKTYNRIIEELKWASLLSEKEGYYYSHFHVLSNGDKSDPSYIRNLAIFNSPEVASLTKIQYRLFLYIATSGIINGAAKFVSVESLYSNKYYSGVNYIENYQDLAKILFLLVKEGLIDVFIEGKVYDRHSLNFEQTFHDYCGYNNVTRKKRISKRKSNKISLRVHLPLIKNIVKNESSRFEIEYLAEQNHISPFTIRKGTVPMFIAIQNELFNLFGVEGVKLYRTALVRYFETEQSNIMYYDLFADPNATKAVNTMVDFYLLEDIQCHIVSATGKQNPAITGLDTFFAEKENLAKLVNYFNEKSSDDHKVVLEELLETNGVYLNTLVATESEKNRNESAWFALHEKVQMMYDLVQYDINVVSAGYQRRVIRQWAKEGILSRKELLKQVVEKLHEKLIFIPLKPTFNLKPIQPVNNKATESTPFNTAAIDVIEAAQKRHIERLMSAPITPDVKMGF